MAKLQTKRRIGSLWVSSILLIFLSLCSPSVGYDLLSSLMSQSSLPNIKSLVSPEILSKVKGLLPSMPHTRGPSDVTEIEKLIAKLKPVEGRFDPAVLELLANMDARMPPGLTNQKLDSAHHHPHHPHNKHNRLKYDEEEIHPPHRQSPHYPPHYDELPLPTTTATGFTITTPDGKQKFSSKFRLEEAAAEQEESSERPSFSSSTTLNSIPQTKSLDHITDPNIRNHRLYELEQGRFETYENFTALDQMEDLLADESSRHEVFVPFENPKKKNPPRHRYKSTTMSPSSSSPPPVSTTSGTNGWIGKPYTPRRPIPSPSVTPTTFSYEVDAVSIESSASVDEDSGSAQILRDREPLKQSSTEKTVIYRQNGPKNRKKTQAEKDRVQDKSSSSSTGRPGRFKPSPIDLSPPVHFEPDQDFYTSTINKGTKGTRRRQQQQKTHNDKSSSDHRYRQQKQQQQLNQGVYPPDDHDQEYQKEQPDFQNAVNYIQSTIKNIPSDLISHFSGNNHYNNQVNVNHADQTLAAKQDRILHNQMPAIPSMYPPPYALDIMQQHGGDTSRLKNPYFVTASSDHVYQQAQPQYYPVQGVVPSQNDLVYSAGQNHYSGHGYPSHHGGGGGGDSSWSSTFFLLGGLIALSAIVAFFLPSFLGAATGKDSGDIDKIGGGGEAETDLWTEIKGLYSDIVNIAKGDYTTFNRPSVRPPRSDLPNIQVVDQMEEDSDGKAVIHKRLGVVSDDEQSEEQSISSSLSQDEEEDEEEDSGSKKPLKKAVNISDTLAFGVFAPGGKVGKTYLNSSRQNSNMNFANAFNQTLQAWEKVRLIVH